MDKSKDNAETTIKEKKPSSNKKKPIRAFTVEEVQHILYKLFNGVSALMKVDERFALGDFENEAKDLILWAEKSTVIFMVLHYLTPLFFILGIFTKVKRISDAFGRKKQVEKAEKEAAMEDVTDYGHNYIT